MKFQDEMLARFAVIMWNRKFTPTDLVSFDDLTKDEVILIMDLAEAIVDILKWEHRKVVLLKWKTVLNFFMENSTRTRTSFELAGKNLAADVINISASSSSMSKWETLLDTTITLDQMQADVIVVRAPSAWVPAFMAKNAKASIINAWDGWNEHPTQALLDLFTMRRFVSKELKWKKMVIVWDVMHSRVFGSLARMTKMFEIDTTVCAPHTLVQTDIDQWWIKYEPNIEKALVWADIVYTLRLQTERAAAAFVPTIREYSKTYGINAKRMQLANKNAVIMHPWPVIRETDVHTNILETDACLVPEQVFSWYCVRFILLWLFSENRPKKNIEKRLFKRGY